MKITVRFLAVLVVLAISGCAPGSIYGGGTVLSGAKITKKGVGHGPPPHAPAHGYRHKHQHGVELEFDSGLGVYAVLGIPKLYFFDGWYFRWSKDHWQVALHYDGSWRRASKRNVPPGLWKSTKQKRHSGKGYGKDKKGK